MRKSLHTPGYRTFQALLRAERERLGISQTELAERMGEGQDFVSKCERGVRRLDVVELVQWCQALGVSFTVFTRKLERKL